MTLLADFRAASKLSVSFKEKFATPLLYATLHLTELPRAKLDGIVCGSATTHFSFLVRTGTCLFAVPVPSCANKLM